MKKRMNLAKVSPDAYKPMVALEKYVTAGLDMKTYHLLKTRASQINGCHYCIDMHTKEAMEDGETAQRLFLLDAWRETPELYTEKEQAVLALTEAMTLISENDMSDELYEQVTQHFSEQEVVALSMAIIAINGWNRLAISFRVEFGSYEPK